MRSQSAASAATLPTSLAALKNHAHFVIAAHCKKYEAIHPTEAVALGAVAGHTVYAREHLKILHTKDKVPAALEMMTAVNGLRPRKNNR